MFTVNRITKSFNLSPVLKDITFSIAPGERVGLIGPNGSGKSTLLRILIGQEAPDSGQVMLTPPNLRLGYLAQGLDVNPSLSLGEALGNGVADPRLLESELEDLANMLAAEPDRSDIQQRYDDLLIRLQYPDNDRLLSVVGHLGLDSLDPLMPIGRLSGGQKTRLALASILLRGPDVLLLDEPTNHLDIPMLEWLEEWLSGFPGAALIVSHDRTFLDHTVTRILDLNPIHHTIREYQGNYSDYLEQFVLERERQLSTWKDQEYEIARIRGDIARTREQARHVEITTKPNQPGVRWVA